MNIYRYRIGPSSYYGEEIEPGLLARCVRLSTENMELKRAGVEDKLEEVALLPPVAPSKIVCVGRNYRAHAQEMGIEAPEDRPLLFFKPPSCLIPHGANIELPPDSTRVDHEGELALVIGRRCHDVPRERAYDVLLGVTAFNDVSARDWQRTDNQWARAKGSDTFGPCGPYIDTTAAEALRLGAQMHAEFVEQTGNKLVDPERNLPLKVTTHVNGELRQEGEVGQMTFGISFLVSYISRYFTLEAGDLIVTGSPEGVQPLNPGDEVVVELSSGPRLVNKVVAAPQLELT